MHPGFIWHWKQHFSTSCKDQDAHADDGVPWQRRGRSCGSSDWREASAAGQPFGVRRPLRFLAWKLELEEEQVARLASILDTLKTERAQADVNWRRSSGRIAEIMAAPELDAEQLESAVAARVDSERHRQDAVQVALTQIHAILDSEQRERLAYLMRTGVLQV